MVNEVADVGRVGLSSMLVLPPLVVVAPFFCIRDDGEGEVFEEFEDDGEVFF